ncbi:hypothetical protein Mspyr1_26650 [Mycolicibacterium gilvum Spyr1]|uniref:Uncharacterized protein n=1 Tax=Mycolicibacterium gilvum (strain DSM 45189 / LMG 24558 / Spyr1) TaxID=278137 RepID=E6TL81_MYCSR|nr:hypothetical protein Mspyr1_26650 [Mycolicibacterium gilvum Spyr1]
MIVPLRAKCPGNKRRLRKVERIRFNFGLNEPLED